MVAQTKINWWQVDFGEKEVGAVAAAIRNRNISQGPITEKFENGLARRLGVPYVVATSSGSASLLMSLLALDIGPGDEVIVPNRGWIATAHAIALVGATSVFADVERHRPVLSVRTLRDLITARTKGVMAVHLNGRAVDMDGLCRLARRYGFAIIEDAAQALFSRNRTGYLGTQGDVGCFSLSMAKICSTGQGGFLVAKSEDLYHRLRAIRTHGLENVVTPGTWGHRTGFNFRLTDMQSSIGLIQLQKTQKVISKLKAIHQKYCDGLDEVSAVTRVPVRIDRGELPLYNEFLCDRRDELVDFLRELGIETRPFLPDLSTAQYVKAHYGVSRNSRRFELRGITFPSGPGQKLSNIVRVVDAVKRFYR